LAADRLEEPAVDHELGAGRTRRAGRGQEDHGIGDLLRLDEPSGRELHHLRRQCGQRALAIRARLRREHVGDAARVGPPGREHRARADPVHADAVHPELLRERLREIAQRRLRRRVVEVELLRLASDSRRHVHDRAAAALEQQRDRRPARAYRGEEIELEDRAPVRVAAAEEPVVRDRAARSRAAGVVDEDVEPAERLDGSRDHLGRRAGVHEVGRHVQQVAPQRVELG
jgi:hypothetical protein